MDSAGVDVFKHNRRTLWHDLDVPFWPHTYASSRLIVHFSIQHAPCYPHFGCISPATNVAGVNSCRLLRWLI